MSKLISVYKSPFPPFPMSIVMHTHVTPMVKNLGIKDRNKKFYNVITDYKSDMRLDVNDINRIGPRILRKLYQKPEFIKENGDKMIKNLKQVNRLLDNYKNNELGELIKKTTALYHEGLYFVEPFGFSLELSGQEIVKQKLKKHLQVNNPLIKESEIENCFSVLSNFTQLSFIQKIEISLFETALAPKKELHKVIDKHVKKYYWQFYDYYGSILTKEDIKKELKVLNKLSKTELKNRIKQIKNKPTQHKREIKNLISYYQISKELAKYFEILREASYYYSDIKKQLATPANVKLGLIIKSLAQKHKINQLDLHYATVEELIDLAINKKINKNKLKQRSKKSVIICQNDKTFYSFLSDKESKKIFQQIKEKKEEFVKQIKGSPACSGNYRGVVKVITNSSQVNKIKKGEVLVAPMTTVNYVPAMKKAGAIITDLGGITCHAAIVSRELNTPCIIATKNATKILKDGDLVEVNANHGIIKII